MTEAKTGDIQADKKPVKLLKSGVNPDVGKATQFQPGQSGNPEGRPKGAISLSTRIQNMLNDEDFETYLPDAREGWRHFKGAAAEAIVKAAIIKAAAGDLKAADWLAKYGYGTKVEVTGAEGEPLIPVVRIIDERPAARDSDSK